MNDGVTRRKGLVSTKGDGKDNDDSGSARGTSYWAEFPDTYRAEHVEAIAKWIAVGEQRCSDPAEARPASPTWLASSPPAQTSCATSAG